MKVTCPSCQSVLNVDEGKIPPQGTRVKCPSCKNIFSISPPELEASQAHAPQDDALDFGEAPSDIADEGAALPPAWDGKGIELDNQGGADAGDDFNAFAAPYEAGDVPALSTASAEKDLESPDDGAPAKRQYYVKRKSGEVFGPFDETVVVQMLQERSVLENDELSLDGQNWEPIAASVLAHHVAAPTRAEGAPPLQPSAAGSSMNRLQQLYEGRMAAVAVVQGKQSVPLKKRLPYIVVGAFVVAVIAVSLALGATPYGYFGFKLLFPTAVKQGTREYAYLEEARSSFLADTWKSYQEAKALSEQVLAVKEYPEARAIWCQAVFYLDRTYNEAKASDLQRARDALVDIALLGKKHPDVLKAFAGDALQRKQPNTALKFISDALARDDGDLEARFLRAEAHLQQNQTVNATREYQEILKKDPKSARALHALGLLLIAQDDIQNASQKFSKALEVAPAHLASAIELAQIAIFQEKDIARGTELLEKIRADDAQNPLSKPERSHALAQRAEVLKLEGELSEAKKLYEKALQVNPNNAFAQAHLAHTLLELHQPEKAVPLYEKAIRAAPESITYIQSYLSALIDIGEMKKAVQVIQAAMAKFPGDARLSFLMGRASELMHKPREAEEAYKRTIAADPNVVDAYLYLSRLYVQLRRFEEAHQQLTTLLKKEPNNPKLYVGIGALNYAEGDLEAAEQKFRQALQLDEKSASAYLGLSKVRLEQEEYELAEAEIAKALEHNPRVHGGQHQHGIVLWRLEALDEALERLKQAQKDEPNNMDIVATIAAVEFEKGELDAASSHLKTVLKTNPGKADARYYMARVLHLRKEYMEATDELRKALNYDPSNSLYHYWMGQIYADAHKTNDALTAWHLAIKNDSENIDALQALGKAYFERHNFKRAIGYYEQVLSLEPDHSEAHEAIGDLQMKLLNWKAAVASYQKLLETEPEIEGGWFKLGQAYEELRKYRKALQSYKQATTQDSDNAEAWLRKGWLHKDLKQKKAAVNAFLNYLRLQPDAENKKQIEDEIYFLTNR